MNFFHIIHRAYLISLGGSHINNKSLTHLFTYYSHGLKFLSLLIFEMLDVQACWMFCRLPGSDCSDERFLEAI